MDPVTPFSSVSSPTLRSNLWRLAIPLLSRTHLADPEGDLAGLQEPIPPTEQLGLGEPGRRGRRHDIPAAAQFQNHGGPADGRRQDSPSR